MVLPVLSDAGGEQGHNILQQDGLGLVLPDFDAAFADLDPVSVLCHDSKVHLYPGRRQGVVDLRPGPIEDDPLAVPGLLVLAPGSSGGKEGREDDGGRSTEGSLVHG